MSRLTPLPRLRRLRHSEGEHRIQAVATLTGIPQATLRAWERRYGIPVPRRTEAGYRLYGEAEIAQARELRRLCDSGLPASEAARRLKLLRERQRSPVGSLRSAPGVLEGSRQAILEAVVRFDDRGLEDALRRTLLHGNWTTVLDDVIVPTLAEIGERWHRGELSVAQEHLAAQHIGHLLRDLLSVARTNQGGERVLLACFADEQHELGLLGTATRLAGWGLQPLLLGARTPPEAVREAIAGLKPRLVALSVTVAPPHPEGQQLVARYARACRGLPWLLGGRGAPVLAAAVRAGGGHLAPESSDQLKRLVLQLLRPPPRRARTGRR